MCQLILSGNIDFANQVFSRFKANIASLRGYCQCMMFLDASASLNFKLSLGQSVSNCFFLRISSQSGHTSITINAVKGGVQKIKMEI